MSVPGSLCVNTICTSNGNVAYRVCLGNARGGLSFVVCFVTARLARVCPAAL